MSKNTLLRLYYPLAIIIWIVFCYSFFMVRTGIMHKMDLGNVIDATEDSQEYIAVTQDDSSYLDVVKDGKVTNIFCADSYFSHSVVQRVAVSEEGVYALLEKGTDEETDDVIYEIVKLNKKMNVVAKTGNVTLPYKGNISEFSSYNGQLYLTQISSSQQEAYLYLISEGDFLSKNSKGEESVSFQIKDVQTVSDTEKILALQYHFGEAVLFTNLNGGSNGREKIIASSAKHLKKAYMNFGVRCKRYHQFFLMCMLTFVVGAFFLLASPTLLNRMNLIMYGYLLWEVFIAFLLGIFALRNGSLLYSLLVLALYVAVSLVGYFILRSHIRNLRVIGDAMEKVLDYDEIPEKPPYVMMQGLNRMWNCLCDMSRLVRRINYQWMDTMQAYYRFSAKGMEQTLGKASITEIKSGDHASFRASVALIGFRMGKPISVEQINNKLLKEGQINLESTMHLISEWQEEKKGQLISNTWDLREMVYLFARDCKDTAQFGMEIGTMLHEHIVIIIHRTNLIYGIAGVPKHSLQYMVNAEISEIQNCMADLQAMGLSFVMTEEAFEEEDNMNEVRFIGELKLECRETPVGLYQVLKGLSKYEQQQLKDTEDTFKRGLKYIKSKDYYLAKSEFAKVIAVHPEDGVAKHYLFLCESSLNLENTKNVEFYLNSH